MHLVVGTPMYGGMCCSEYTQSILSLQEACIQNGIKLTSIFIGNESLIQRGRNNIARAFLELQADYLMFIDADQKFLANDIAKMIKANKGIIGGAVPMKDINWESVRSGAEQKHPALHRLTGVFNVNELEGHGFKKTEEPFQVKHVGTGFMLIKREVFEHLAPHVGWYTEKQWANTIAKPSKVYDFFQVGKVDNQLLSEDYFFCHKYREVGGEIWLAPWCQLGHFGSYLFSGQYAYQNEVQNAVSSNEIHSIKQR